jgi:thiamine pyrophosphokinase
MHVLILAHGDFPGDETLDALRETADLFIATDGAADPLLARGIVPDVVLGDLDSLSPEGLLRLPPGILQPAPDQEASDLEKAILHAIAAGAGRVTLLGTTGSRVDHTLVAFSLLHRYGEAVDLRLRAPASETRLVYGETTVEGEPGDTVSLIPFAPVEGVTFEGVRWPLRDEPLHPGSRGVSNVLTAPRARLVVRGGKLLLCRSWHPARRGHP